MENDQEAQLKEYQENWNSFFEELKQRANILKNLEIIQPNLFDFYVSIKLNDDQFEKLDEIKNKNLSSISYNGKHFGFLRTVDDTYHIFVDFKSEDTNKPTLIINNITEDVFCLSLTTMQEMKMALNMVATTINEYF